MQRRGAKQHSVVVGSGVASGRPGFIRAWQILDNLGRSTFTERFGHDPTDTEITVSEARKLQP